MTLHSHRHAFVLPVPPRRTLSRAAAAFLLLSSTPAASVSAQDSAAPRARQDLSSKNFSRVGASATQIQEVLRREPGLLVELKRWVAKEATDRGQIVDDEALTEQGIFSRLDADPEFRALATRLLQRYGHLVPKPLPMSEAAEERGWLLHESRSAIEKAGGPAAEQTTDPQQTGGTVSRPAPVVPSPSVPAASRSLKPFGDEAVLTSAQLLRSQAEVPLNSVRRPSDPDLVAIEAARVEQEERAAMMGELRERATNSPPPAEVAPSHPSRPAPPNRASSAPSSEAVIHRVNPYAGIPSLFDLYAQVNPHAEAPERFGMSLFRSRAGQSDALPMDLPAGHDYVVGPGDGLTIDLWGSISQRLYRIVDREGRLPLPEVGPILVSGQTLGEMHKTIQQALRTQFRAVSADVSLARLRTIRVYVVGDVEQPGAYDISSLSTPLNALFAAGGPTARGSLRLLKHFRGKQIIQEADVYELLLQGARVGTHRLESGDTVMVPPLGAQVTVTGMVRRPGVYELRGERTMSEALQLAGGILPAAMLRKIRVERIQAHQKRTMLSLDLDATHSAALVAKRMGEFIIQDRDEICISPIAPYIEAVVYLQGHVLRPGRYPHYEGMKLTELIASHQDLLPEPAMKYAEIIRLNPPDYRPTVASFDLATALANPAKAPTLSQLDTIRIFSRFDFENPPEVWVGGEVRNPGSYAIPGQAYLRDAIHMAGGLTPDALRDTAQVFRHLPGGQLRIFSVNLNDALAAAPGDNVLLQPRDTIVVHPIASRVDPPTVSATGEVAKPGRYPLTDNMRVSDLVRLVGGLKRSAEPFLARLTRFSQGTSSQITEHHEIRIVDALSGDPDHDLPLHDNDLLSIFQRPGWSDVGATILLRGEVHRPGTYGIQPGEKLSSVLRQAGGYLPTAYPPAAVLIRRDIRELQEKSRQETIERLEREVATFKVSLNESAKEKAELQQAALEQRQRVLDGLRSASASGRLVIRLPRNLHEFAASRGDIELRSGDTLFIPKRPDFVLVTGQVYNVNAITHEPGKSAAWYLKQAGGTTGLADTKAIFIIRASGSVVTGKGQGWWGENALSTRIEPGDVIVVPEKPIGGSTFWKNFMTTAQIASSTAISAAWIVR